MSDIIIIDDSDQEAGVRKLVEEVQEDTMCYSISGCFDNTVEEEWDENTTNTPNSRVVITSDTDVHADMSCPWMGAAILANPISLWKSPIKSCYIGFVLVGLLQSVSTT